MSKLPIISKQDRADIVRLLTELQNSDDDIKTLADKRYFDWNQLQVMLTKDDKLRNLYEESIQIQKSLRSSRLLKGSLDTLEKMMNGEVKETRTNYVVDKSGKKTPTSITELQKAPDFRAVEKLLKTFAPEQFGDKLSPEKMYSIFMAFNRFIVDVFNRPDLVEELYEIEKAFINKLNTE